MMFERREERGTAADMSVPAEDQEMRPQDQQAAAQETAFTPPRTDAAPDREAGMEGPVGQGELSTADVARAAQSSQAQQGSGTEAIARGAEPAPVMTAGQTDAEPTPLFAPNEAEEFRSRWSEIQIGFVDEPRRAVEEADSLVAETIRRLAETFAEERANLERQWSGGGDVSTEDLRIALQRYRSFFDRLLSLQH